MFDKKNRFSKVDPLFSLETRTTFTSTHDSFHERQEPIAVLRRRHRTDLMLLARGRVNNQPSIRTDKKKKKKRKEGCYSLDPH